MTRVQINTSSHGTPGEVVAVEEGQIVWAGPIEAITEAESFDELFCHDDDLQLLIGLVRAAGYEAAARG